MYHIIYNSCIKKKKELRKLSDILSAISNVGFPIVMCILFFLQNEKMRQSIDRNSTVIEELKDEIKGGGKNG